MYEMHTYIWFRAVPRGHTTRTISYDVFILFFFLFGVCAAYDKGGTIGTFSPIFLLRHFWYVTSRHKATVLYLECVAYTRGSLEEHVTFTFLLLLLLGQKCLKNIIYSSNGAFLCFKVELSIKRAKEMTWFLLLSVIEFR